MAKNENKLFQCWFPWTHSFGWPMLDKRSCKLLEHCTVCGASREAGETLLLNSGLSGQSAENIPKSADQIVVE